MCDFCVHWFNIARYFNTFVVEWYHNVALLCLNYKICFILTKALLNFKFEKKNKIVWYISIFELNCCVAFWWN